MGVDLPVSMLESIRHGTMRVYRYDSLTHPGITKIAPKQIMDRVESQRCGIAGVSYYA
jgi:hypothetical protein